MKKTATRVAVAAMGAAAVAVSAATTDQSQPAQDITELVPEATSKEPTEAPAELAVVADDVEHIEAVDAVDPHEAEPVPAEAIHAGLVEVSTAQDEAENVEAAEVDDDADVDTIAVVAKREGFRRAGRSFGAQPTFIRTAELTDEQLRDLIKEPMLVVAFSSHMKGN